jgi:hypothetical protein
MQQFLALEALFKPKDASVKQEFNKLHASFEKQVALAR